MSFQDEIGEWGNRTFTKATEHSIIAHLRREVEEVQKSVDLLGRDLPEGIRKQMREELGFELADCYMLLLHLAHRNRVDLVHFANIKFEINQARQWGQPDSEGVCEHIKEVERCP